MRLANAAFDDILELDNAEQAAVLGHGKGCAARFGDRLRDCLHFAHGIAAYGGLQDANRARRTHQRRWRVEIVQDCFDRALAYPGAADFNAAHAALRGERDEVGA